MSGEQRPDANAIRNTSGPQDVEGLGLDAVAVVTAGTPDTGDDTMPQQEPNGRGLQRAATWLEVVIAVVTLGILLGGWAWTISQQVQRHEWWIAAHKDWTDKRVEAADTGQKATAALLADTTARLCRLETKVDILLQDRGGGKR